MRNGVTARIRSVLMEKVVRGVFGRDSVNWKNGLTEYKAVIKFLVLEY